MKLAWPALLALTTIPLAPAAVSAADLSGRPYVKTDAIAAPIGWTGAYVGAQVGGRWSDATWTTTAYGNPIMPAIAIPRIASGNPANFDAATVRAGGYAGYNWQFSPQWVIGIEGDIAWGNSSKSRAGIPGTWVNGAAAADIARDGSQVKEGWDASLRARLGWLATSSTLLYGTGGVAWQELSVNASCVISGAWDCGASRNETFKTIRTGWTAGAGLETRISANALARVEYRYADYGRVDHLFFPNAGLDAVWMNQTLKTHTVSVGIAYQFGGPVVAKY